MEDRLMKIGVLCSGVALGVYIPGIHLDRNFKRNGTAATVFVLEDLIAEEKKGKINQNKKAFHKNFAVALMGQRLTRDLLPDLDQEKLEEFFAICLTEKIDHFIVISGFWLSVLELFKERDPQNLFYVDCLHIDCDYSPSWKIVNYQADYCVNNWLLSYDDQRIIAELNTTELPPLPFARRRERFLTHGGGWGMGTYLKKLPELHAAGFNLDVVIHELGEAPAVASADRYWMIDPDWSPWLKDQDQKHQFPPLGEVIPGQEVEFKNNPDHPMIFEITREVKGVITKPGGSTLLDSLAAATPLIFLAPFGAHEAKNAALWEKLGFGIDYDTWRKAGFPVDVLERMHENLAAARGRAPKFVDLYLQKKGVSYFAGQNRS
jgi:hypothetical protein